MKKAPSLPTGILSLIMLPALSPEYLSFVYSLASEAPNFELSWDQALSPSQADALLTNLEQLFTGQKSPEEFCAAMDSTIEQK